MSTVSFIVPSTCRPSLKATLDSIETWAGDEIIVVSDMALNLHMQQFAIGHGARFVHCQPGNDWGSAERNMAMPLAKGDYLSFMDDDDVYAPGHRQAMGDVMEKNPGQPVLFKMKFPMGLAIPYEGDTEVRCGNFGTPCIFVPNAPAMLGAWGAQWGGDWMFMDSCKWPKSAIVWRPEVIAYLGHNP